MRNDFLDSGTHYFFYTGTRSLSDQFFAAA